MQQLFFEVEATLSYHLWGMKFLTCLEWFQQIQAESWQGHQHGSLGPFPLHCPRAILAFFFCLSSRSSFKKLQGFFFFYLFTNSATSGLRGALVLVVKNQYPLQEGEKERENMLKREGDRLLSLSVWPCLTAVISLNCFANIIPTQPGSRSARPLCWSWLEAVLLHDLSLSLPFFFSSVPFRPISIRMKTYSRNLRQMHCFLFQHDPGLD